MATKADLEAVAKNVEIRALGRQVERVITEGRALRGDLRLLTSICNGIAVAIQRWFRLFGQLPGRNKLKAGSRLLV